MIGEELDDGHPDAIKWLAKGLTEAKPAPVEVEADGDMPSAADFTRLTFHKRTEEVIHLRSRNERDAGRLIEREFVRQHVVSHLETLHSRLLGPGASTIAARLTGAVHAGQTAGELKALVSSILSSHLRAAKKRTRDGILAAPIVGATPEPLTPSPPEDPSTGLVRDLARDIERRLREKAAPKIVDGIVRSVARLAGGGGRFDPDTFERVRAALGAVTDDAVRLAATITASHVRAALRDFDEDSNAKRQALD